WRNRSTDLEEGQVKTRPTLLRLLALLLGFVLVAAACGDDDSGGDSADGGATTTEDGGGDGGTTGGGGEGALAGVCPETVIIQTDWNPEAEHGAAYQLVGDDYEIDAGAFATRGSLVDSEGNDTGVEI